MRLSQAGADIGSLGEGDFIGEISLIEGRPRTATAIAVDDVTVAVVRRTEFNELMDSFSTVRLGVMTALTDRIRRDESSSLA